MLFKRLRTQKKCYAEQASFGTISCPLRAWKGLKRSAASVPGPPCWKWAWCLRILLSQNRLEGMSGPLTLPAPVAPKRWFQRAGSHYHHSLGNQRSFGHSIHTCNPSSPEDEAGGPQNRG